MSDDRLFDPADYGATNSGSGKPRKPPPPPAIIRRWTLPWILLRTGSGLQPYFHLPAATTHTGATETCCGQLGTAITEPDSDTMVCCPTCEEIGDPAAILRGM